MSLLSGAGQSGPNERVVLWLRRIPRFGHSNNLALLASENPDYQQDYVDGIISFSILILFVILIWFMILFLFKFYYGYDRVGCAAGGKSINISSLRKSKFSRSLRRAILLRNWRTQSVFLICSIGLTALSFPFVNHGLKPFMESLRVLDATAMDMDAKSFEAMRIARTVEQVRVGLVDWDAPLNVTSICPDYATNPFFQDSRITQGNASLYNGIRYINGFVDRHAVPFTNSVSRMTSATLFVEEKIDAASSKERLIQALLIAFNIINAFLFFGALLAKNNVHSQQYQNACSFAFVPAFSLLMLGLLAATCITSTMSVINADFCSGGKSGTSARATVLDLLSARGLNSSHLSYQAIDYYSNECQGANPLGVLLHDFGQRIATSTNHLEALQTAINSYDLDSVSAACGGDIYPFNETVGKIHNSLKVLLWSMEQAKNMTACGAISPIFRHVVHGPPCTQSVEGLSCLLGTACGMLILGMIMVSTRAALYNPVIRPRRRKRREREFKEYVEYMGSFYDTADWKLDAAIKAGKPASIQPAPTFETAGSDESPTGSPRSQQEDSRSESDGSGSFDGQEVVLGMPSTTANVSDQAPTRSRHYRHKRVLPPSSTLPLHAPDEDPNVEYYSSDSEESTGAESNNISVLVSRFFVVQRQSNNDQSFSSGSDSSVLNRSFRSLLGPAIDFMTPIRKKGVPKSQLDRNDAPFDESFNISDELSLAIESSTPSPVRSSKNRLQKASAPQKHHLSLLRTSGATKAAASRSDVV